MCVFGDQCVFVMKFYVWLIIIFLVVIMCDIEIVCDYIFDNIVFFDDISSGEVWIDFNVYGFGLFVQLMVDIVQ